MISTIHYLGWLRLHSSIWRSTGMRLHSFRWTSSHNSLGTFWQTSWGVSRHSSRGTSSMTSLHSWPTTTSSHFCAWAWEPEAEPWQIFSGTFLHDYVGEDEKLFDSFLTGFLLNRMILTSKGTSSVTLVHCWRVTTSQISLRTGWHLGISTSWQTSCGFDFSTSLQLGPPWDLSSWQTWRLTGEHFSRLSVVQLCPFPAGSAFWQLFLKKVTCKGR
jgi:hypothetical protein